MRISHGGQCSQQSVDVSMWLVLRLWISSCLLKAKFLLARLKSASGDGCGKGHLHMKQISIVFSLLEALWPSSLDFSLILRLVYVFSPPLRSWAHLEPENLLLPTERLTTMILVAMPFLADWDGRSQDANLGLAMDNSVPCPSLHSSFWHFKSYHQRVHPWYLLTEWMTWAGLFSRSCTCFLNHVFFPV